MKKVLLLGDSVGIGYRKYVKFAFENAAEVYFPNDNCRFSAFIVRFLDIWKGTLSLSDVDMVYFNAGLWDVAIMDDGKPTISKEEYRKNISRLCDIIKILFPSAKIVFATTTPVLEEGVGEFKRFNKDIEEYNAIAVEEVKNKGGEIDDLYSTVKEFPKEYYSDSTYLYTKKATEILTKQVVATIEKTLDIKSTRSDIGEKYEQNIEILGLQ